MLTCRAPSHFGTAPDPVHGNKAAMVVSISILWFSFSIISDDISKSYALSLKCLLRTDSDARFGCGGIYILFRKTVKFGTFFP